MTDLRNWKAQLFQCCNESGFAIAYFCCPCLQCCLDCSITCTNFSSWSEHSPFLRALVGFCFGCFGLGYNRMTIRKHLNIKGSYIEDCLCHMFCHCCAIIQELREVKIYEAARLNQPNVTVIVQNQERAPLLYQAQQPMAYQQNIQAVNYPPQYPVYQNQPYMANAPPPQV